MEITDRDDLGVDLKAPQTGDNGRPYWSYELVTDVRPGDVVLHYYKPHKAIVAVSQATGDHWEEDIVWASHGTVARSAGIQPYRRPGYRRALERFIYLRDPVSLDELRAGEGHLRTAAGAVERLRRGPTYFPFAISDRRPIRPQQGYLTKVPKSVVDAFPALRAAVSELAEADRSTAPIPALGVDYRPAAEDAATSERDPFLRRSIARGSGHPRSCPGSERPRSLVAQPGPRATLASS